MGFAGYFLIVQDFINWAQAAAASRSGPGRGSGAGSLVAYALRITDLDPIPYSLLFERFLNPERVSMPDFDIDFCMDRRDEVIDYVRGKYGTSSVGQIATFHVLKSTQRRARRRARDGHDARRTPAASPRSSPSRCRARACRSPRRSSRRSGSRRAYDEDAAGHASCSTPR